MKKVFALVLAVALSLSLVACGGSASSAPAASSAAEAVSSTAAAGGKVGVCIYKFDDAFMTLYREELDSYLSGMGYEVTVVDGKNDQATQTEQVNTFITQGVDVLVVNLVQSSAAPTVIEAAKAADIPVVFINREPTPEDLASYEKCCYVGADARQSGTFQGEIIATTENKGDFNGNGTVDYIMIMGDPENVDAQYRTEFSIKALEEAGLKVNELFKQRGDWDRSKGQELAANALTQFGDKIDVIFCNNDDMAIGAAQAITAAGRTVGKDIYLVGVDALAEAQ
ncbi:MAG: galactose ABC transporter substrate-binding protein, partial [Pygmaiobacter sp.]